MGEHVVTVKMRFGDDGVFQGLERVSGEAHAVQSAAKLMGDALSQAGSKAGTATTTLNTNLTRLRQTAATLGVDVRRLAAEEAAAANAERAAAAAAAAVTRMRTAEAEATRAETAAARELAAAERDAAKAAKESAGASNNEFGAFFNQLKAVKGQIFAIIAALGVMKAVHFLEEKLDEGVRFNAILETSRLGGAALLGTFAQIFDAQGKRLDGTLKQNEADRVSVLLQEQLKQRALTTALTYEQLLEVQQRGLPYLLAAFRQKDGYVADTSKLVDFVATFSQAAASAGLPAEEIPINLQRFLQGTADPRHARFAAQLLQTISPTGAGARAQMDEWKQEGVLLEKLNEKLSSFQALSEKVMETYEGAKSNFHDVIQQLLGKGTEDLTKELAKTFNEIADSLFIVDESGHRAFDPALVNAIKEVAKTAAGVVTTFADLVFFLEKVADLWHELGEDKGGPGEGVVLDGTKKRIDQLKYRLGEKELHFKMGSWSIDERPIKEKEIADLKALLAQQEALFARTQKPAKDMAQQMMLQVIPHGTQMIGFRRENLTSYGQQLIDLSKTNPAEYLLALRKINEAAKAGTLTQIALSKALREAHTEIERAHIKPPNGGDEEKEDKGFEQFKRWMEQFHIKAEPTNGDAIAKALQDIAVERKQAVDKLEAARKKFKKEKEDWDKDLSDINATFNNKEGDLWAHVQKQLAPLADMNSKYGNAAAASPDPLSQKLADIKTQRENALRQFADLKKRFGDVVMADWDGMLENIQKSFDRDSARASADAIAPIDQQTLEHTRRIAAMQQQIAIEAQDETERLRISTITNSIDRELATRLAANQKWAAEKRKEVELEYKDEVRFAKQKQQALDLIAKAQKEKDERDEKEAERRRQAQLAGTNEWIADIARRVEEAFPPVGVKIADAILGDMQALESGFDDLFAHIGEKGGAGKALSDFGAALTSNWRHVLSSMLSDTILNGKSISAQFSQIFAGMNGGSSLDKALAGAGLGGVIGGMFQKPGNQAGVGGTIGGALGAVIGAYFGGNAVLGSMIGSAIGTAIGSMIQKGEDYINVSIVKGVATVTEKGISAQARQDVQTQVTRHVHDSMKQWQNVIDTFPDLVRMQLEKEKVVPGDLYLTGEVKDGDIRDENAVQALNDFFSNKLEKATWSAYKGAISRAITLMGVDVDHLSKAMAYFGTLQGNELQDAVRKYVVGLTGFVANRDKMGSWENMLASARTKSQATSMTPLDDTLAQMSHLVEKLPKLTDVDDQISAFETLNSLSDQFFTGMENALVKINQMQEATHQQLDGLLEQLDLAGKNDQQKVDYFYGRLNDLRFQLAHASTEDDVQRITQLMMGYVQQIMGIAGNGPAVLDNLKAIVGDIYKLSDQGYETARSAGELRQIQAFDLLNKASQALLGAVTAINTGANPRGRPSKPSPPPGGGNPKQPFNPEEPFDPATTNYIASLTASSTANDTFTVSLNAAAAAVDRFTKWTLEAPDGKPVWMAETINETQLALQVNRIVDVVVQAQQSIEATINGDSTRRSSSDSTSQQILRDINAAVRANGNRKLEIVGDGAEFLEAIGMQVIEAAEARIMRRLRDEGVI